MADYQNPAGMLGQALLQQGLSTAPAPALGGAARIGTALAGALLMRRAQKDENERLESQRSALGDYLRGINQEGAIPLLQGLGQGGMESATGSLLGNALKPAAPVYEMLTGEQEQDLFGYDAPGTYGRLGPGGKPELIGGTAPKPLEAPTTRTVNIGAETVTQQFDQTSGGWQEVGRAPRFEPDATVDMISVEEVERLGLPTDRGQRYKRNSATNEIEVISGTSVPAPTVSLDLSDKTTGILNDSIGEAATARQSIADQQFMMDRLDEGLTTGALSPIGSRAASFLSSLTGIDIQSDLPAAQAFEALSNRAALVLRNPESGLGLTGNTSDRDLRFLKSSVAGLGTGEEANRILLITGIARDRRKAELAEGKAEWISETGGLRGWPEEQRRMIESTPLYTTAEEDEIRRLSILGREDQSEVVDELSDDQIRSILNAPAGGQQ